MPLRFVEFCRIIENEFEFTSVLLLLVERLMQNEAKKNLWRVVT